MMSYSAMVGDITTAVGVMRGVVILRLAVGIGEIYSPAIITKTVNSYAVNLKRKVT